MPLRIRLGLIARTALPVAAWGLALCLLLLLMRERTAPAQVIGLARESSAPVSSLVNGRIASIAVRLHQDVEAGAPVALLEDDAARLQVEAALLEIERLGAELRAAELRLLQEGSTRTLDRAATRRRLELDVLEARLARLDEQGLRGRDAETLAGLELRLEWMAELIDSDIVPEREIEDTRAEVAALAARIAGRDATIEGWRLAESEAAARLETLPPLEEADAAPLLAPLADAIRLAELRLEQAQLASAQVVVRAPISGRVAEVLQKAGEAVVVDEPIARISAPGTVEVVAWIREEQLARFEPGAAVELRRFSDRRTVGVGEIASLGPAVTAVPAPALLDPARPEYGVPALVRGPAELALVPGERVAIRLKSHETTESSRR